MISRRRLGQRIRDAHSVAAVLHDRHLTVLASSPPARRLTPAFAEGVNLVRFTFVDVADVREQPCWPAAAQEITAMFREGLERSVEDDVFRGILGELSLRSPEFARFWADEASAVGGGRISLGGRGVAAIRYRSIHRADAELDGVLIFAE